MSNQDQGKSSQFAQAALGCGVVAAGVFAAAAALAATPCTVAGIEALHVPNVVSVTSAMVVGPDPAHPLPFCQVVGFIETDHNQAGFQVNLPANNWNHKFLFIGVGGLAGDPLPEDFGSANVLDQILAPLKGYATVITDTGHTTPGATDASWALNPDGTPNEPRLTDYYFRATHAVTVAAKELVRAFYGAAIQRAYFDGCSNGGRQAMMEASRFPDDYDGIIAGDPFMSLRSILGGVHFNKQQLSANTFIPFTKLPMIDAATTASCDAADGVKDGLIQNPAACHFDPNTLVKQGCAITDNTCLSQGEADTLRTYFSAARDDDGNVVYPGGAISNLAGGDSKDGADLWSTGFLTTQTTPAIDFNAVQPWGPAADGNQPVAWGFVDNIIRFIVERDPNFVTRRFDGTTNFPVSDAALNLYDSRTGAGDADNPEKFRSFIAKNKKLIIYHGFSDPALTAMRSIMFYDDLADGAEGGIEETQDNVRLFLVPGMHHCLGGPGPNVFDTLTALENWVENGQAPEAIVAAHFPGSPPVGTPGTEDRTMPLCKYPEVAQFKLDPKTATPAQINDAANWACRANDRRLLDVELNGREAGLGGRQARSDGDEGDDREDGGDR
jgi:feruloyl esterase